MSDPLSHLTGLCTYCPKMCRVACPVSEETGSEAVTPWGLMTLLGAVRQKRLELDAEVGGLFWQCTGCLRCRSFCTHENDVPRALAEARRLAMEAGVAPQAARDTAARMREHGNPQGTDLAARQLELLGERPEQGARTLFFPGCEALADGGDAVQDAVRLLEHLDYGPVTVLEDAPCCGRPYDDCGVSSELRTHASRMAQRLSRFALVVSGSPGCVHALRDIYPELGSPVRARVVHLTELLVERMPSLATQELKVAYHDPCHLGRGLGVYEAPRELLRRAGAQLVEFFEAREVARCSGGGFGFPSVEPELARGIAARRVADLPADADVLATACPTCARQLEAVSPTPVVDLATVLARALGLRE